MSANVSLTTETFGVLADKEGRSIPVEKFIWQTRAGLRLCVLALDAAIVELRAPDGDRAPANILLAPDTLQEFLQLDPNLICGACFGPSDCMRPAEKQRMPQDEGVQTMASDRIWQPFVDGTRLHLSRQLVAGRRNTLCHRDHLGGALERGAHSLSGLWCGENRTRVSPLVAQPWWTGWWTVRNAPARGPD
ncbi:uncharacterized protein LOC126577446 [Anopheles aquasalis]|uniref:uncharacterized protein LOC126577446 n=1 Tax=Anopheles aquasalis TaxID=42839 RepID=UPI00215AEB24|nr:uncharacterized protein LOC126577446 [Anopheles aquasalis]